MQHIVDHDMNRILRELPKFSVYFMKYAPIVPAMISPINTENRMRRTRITRRRFRIVCQFTCLVGLIGISAKFSANAAQDVSPVPAAIIRLVLVLDSNLPAAYTENVRDGAAQAATEHSIELIVHADGKSVAGEFGDIIAKQQIRPVTGIVMATPSPDDMAAALALAKNAELPVVTIGPGMDIARAIGAVLHIGPDNFAAGRAAGEQLRDRGTSRATCIKSPANTIAQDLRCMGLRAGLEQPVTILMLPDPGQSLADTAQRLLDRRKAGDALLFAATNPLAAETASLSASRASQPVIIAAFDPDTRYANRLAGGDAAFAVDTQPRLQGYLPIVVLANAARTGALPTSNIATGPNIVTPDDARKLLLPSSSSRPPQPANSARSDGVPDTKADIEDASPDSNSEDSAVAD